MTTLVKTLDITSSAFRHENYIPHVYTCEGDNINPPLRINDVPEETRSLVLIIDDPDAPGKTFDHWVVWNILPETTIDEDSIPGTVGRNSARENKYCGPCPPSGTHRYFFKVYALDKLLDLEMDSGKKAVEQAMEGHVLAYGELIGLYKKSKA